MINRDEIICLPALLAAPLCSIIVSCGMSIELRQYPHRMVVTLVANGVEALRLLGRLQA